MKRTGEDTTTEPKNKKVKESVALENPDLKVATNKQAINAVKEKKRKVNFEKPLTKKTDKKGKTKLPSKFPKHDKIQHKTPGGMAENEKQQVQLNGNNVPTEKPDWLEFKKKKKELKEARKAKKLTAVYDVSVKAKQLCEKLRRADCTTEDREKLTQKLHNLLQKNYTKLIFTHDMSRTIQWLLRYSNTSIRKAVFTELKPSIVLILQSKYAKNCIRTILKYGSREVKGEIIKACYGNVVKLMTHMVSASILEFMYASHALEEEKCHFKQEFYGDMYKGAKDSHVKTLADVFKTASAMKSATLSAVKANLIKILNKNLVSSTLVQTVVHEFFSLCTPEDRGELITMLRNSIVELSRTKIGAKVAVACIWHGSNKDRKMMMKALKENVLTLSMSEEGYIILLALADTVDDTVVLRKIIISEMQDKFTEMVLNEYGRLVILYLIARRDPHYFPPSMVDFLKQGDDNATSKKPADIRAKEIREGVIDTLLEAIASNITSWMSSAPVLVVTLAVLKVGGGEKLKTAFKSLAEYITNPESKIKEGEVEHKLVEHAGGHMILKKLIQNDKTLADRGETTFGEVLLSCLNGTVVKEWIKFNRGCFLLVVLFENEPTSVVNSLCSMLKPLKGDLKANSNSGASILITKIKSHTQTQ